MKLTRTALFASVGILCALASGASAQTLNALDQGWFNAGGGHTHTNDNYIVGQANGTQYRNFFVFDLSGVNSMITSAELDLFNPAYLSPDATETFNLTGSTTNANLLSGINYSGAAGQAIYNTFGVGPSLGSLVASSAMNNTLTTITLNNAGLAYLNANLGQKVVLSGHLTTISGNSQQYVYGFTGGRPQQLRIQQGPGTNVTPEVPGLVMALPMIMAVGGMALYQRKKKSA